jgi:quinoprotein glucose dehydrogenase
MKQNLSLGHFLFNINCSQCHGANLKGNHASGIPSLVNIKDRRSKEYVMNRINNGGGRMPAFKNILSDKKKKAIVKFLFGNDNKKLRRSKNKRPRQRYSESSFLFSSNRFLTKDGYPATRPPWGTLSAINLSTGKYVWRDTLGTFPELEAKGIPKTGSRNYGGPLVTSGGLIFIAATADSMFRAYDKSNGKLIWKTKLPNAGFATPSTYKINGTQYIVIACGGDKLGLPAGQSYVAYSLK